MQASTAMRVTHHAAHAVMTWALRNEATLPHGRRYVCTCKNESKRWKM